MAVKMQGNKQQNIEITPPKNMRNNSKNGELEGPWT